jgi:hypothetical protein
VYYYREEIFARLRHEELLREAQQRRVVQAILAQRTAPAVTPRARGDTLWSRFKQQLVDGKARVFD